MSSELPPPKPGDRAVRPKLGAPNYAVRRAMVAGAAVIVAALAVAATAIAIRGEGDDDSGVSTTWNAVALVSRVNGAVRVLDEDGEEITTIRGTGRVEAVHASGNRLALVGPTQIALVGIEGDEPIVVPIEQDSTVSRVATNGSFTLVVAPAATGNLTLIDASDGTQLDVGELAEQNNPMLLPDSIRADADGTAFAIGDGRNFQTVVVRFGRADATFFPDVPMAVADDLVITSQTVGTSAEIGFFAADGERRASVASEERPIGGLIDGDRFVFVSDTGRRYRGDRRRRVRLAVLAWIALPAGRRRPSRVAGARRHSPRRHRHRIPGDRRPRRNDLVPDHVCHPDRNPHADADVALRPDRRQRRVHFARRPRHWPGSRRPARRRRGHRQQRRVCGVQLDSDRGRSIVTPSDSMVLPAAVSTTWIAPDASRSGAGRHRVDTRPWCASTTTKQATPRWWSRSTSARSTGWSGSSIIHTASTRQTPLRNRRPAKAPECSPCCMNTSPFTSVYS